MATIKERAEGYIKLIYGENHCETFSLNLSHVKKAYIDGAVAQREINEREDILADFNAGFKYAIDCASDWLSSEIWRREDDTFIDDFRKAMEG